MFRTKTITIRDFPEQSKKILELSRAHASESVPLVEQHEHPTAGATPLSRVLHHILEKPAQSPSDESALEKAVKGLLKEIQRVGGPPKSAAARRPAGANGHEMEPDIFVVGDQPVYLIDGELLLHEAAEMATTTELSFGRQDVLVYESKVPFAVDFHALGGRIDAGPPNPFYRDDLPFASRYDAEHAVFRVVAGCIRFAAVSVQHYKATILLDGRRTIDPDIVCSP